MNFLKYAQIQLFLHISTNKISHVFAKPALKRGMFELYFDEIKKRMEFQFLNLK